MSDALHKAATKIQAHYRGHIVRKAVRLYRIGGIVSECLYSPGTGLKPPKNIPRPIGRINAAMTVRGNILYLFGGMLEVPRLPIHMPHPAPCMRCTLRHMHASHVGGDGVSSATVCPCSATLQWVSTLRRRGGPLTPSPAPARAQIGDTEITLDDMWSLDLAKLSVWTCHKELTTLPDDLKPVQSDSEGESLAVRSVERRRRRRRRRRRCLRRL